MQTRIKTDLTAEPLTLVVMKHFLKYEEGEADAEALTAEESLINAMISSVRTILEKRTELVFAEKVIEILFDPDDYPFVIPVSPIISVDKVITIDYTGTESDPLALNTGYYKTGMYEIELTVPEMIKSSKLKATVTVGYGNDDTEILPVALMDAMKTQVFQWYQNRDDFMEGNVLGLIDKVVMLFKREFV